MEFKNCHAAVIVLFALFTTLTIINGSLTAPPQVNATVYMEALCPDTRVFILNKLSPVYGRFAKFNILHLELVLFGKAHETRNGTSWDYTCQHGQKECQGNYVYNCALNYTKNFDDVFGFIYCMEQGPIFLSSVEQATSTCGTKHNIDINAVLECSRGSQGRLLHHEMGLKTSSLKPPLSWVPTITINGERNDEIQQKAEHGDLLQLICDKYTGSRPAVCSGTNPVG